MKNNYTSILNKPLPIDKEVLWDKTKTIISQTDTFGTILSINDAFTEVSGYTDKELVSQPHSIIRHPDMPKAIYRLLWNNLKNNENFYGIVKNLAKSGEYYWVLTDFDIIKNKSGKVTNYAAQRIALPQEVITNEIEPLYKRLAKLEEFYGAQGSENYFQGFLEKENKTYVEYISAIMAKYPNPYTFNKNKQIITEEGSKNFLKRLFG